MHYLDHNATSPLRPESLSAMTHALTIGGNPSSIHANGRAARAVVEDAREKVAALVGAVPISVIFTSGATESNALASVRRRRRLAGRTIRASRVFLFAPSSTSRCWRPPSAWPNAFPGFA